MRSRECIGQGVTGVGEDGKTPKPEDNQKAVDGFFNFMFEG